jgi:hypothetical protein
VIIFPAFAVMVPSGCVVTVAGLLTTGTSDAALGAAAVFFFVKKNRAVAPPNIRTAIKTVLFFAILHLHLFMELLFYSALLLFHIPF